MGNRDGALKGSFSGVLFLGNYVNIDSRSSARERGGDLPWIIRYGEVRSVDFDDQVGAPCFWWDAKVRFSRCWLGIVKVGARQTSQGRNGRYILYEI